MGFNWLVLLFKTLAGRPRDVIQPPYEIESVQLPITGTVAAQISAVSGSIEVQHPITGPVSVQVPR